MKLPSRIRKWLRSTLANPATWVVDWLQGPETFSGVRVNEFSALNSTAVFAAVRVLAESVGFLPLILYERLQPRGKQRATSHPLYSLLHDAPNEYMTSVTFRETLMGHLALWGNAYAEIEWDKAGRVVAFWPLLPSRVKPEVQIGGSLLYRVQPPNGPEVILLPGDVLHIPGLGYDGVKGYSPITLARQSVGLTLAAEEFGSRFFRNSATPTGVLEHPGTLDDVAQKRIRDSFEQVHAGLSNAHRVAILEEGMKYQSIGMSSKDAQFLETRKFQISEIARMFRVPPHMLADLEKATFTNIEHQSLEFVIFTLGPWIRRWEQELNRKLLSTQASKRYFIEFLVDGLLRGDIKSRYESYAIARQWGWLSANEIRELENMNPIDRGGDEYLVPLNMTSAKAALVGGQAPANGEPDPTGTVSSSVQ